MDKKIKIIVDSNYIYNHDSRRLKSLIDNLNTKGEIYIPDVVLDELVQRDINSIGNVNKLIDDRETLKNIIQIDNVNAYQINNIREYYSNIFKDRIIKLSNVDINEIYKRSLSKKPPFSTDKNASDKGFKDSLIWLSILEDEHKSYDEVILLSSDKSFINNKVELQKEFIRNHNIEISFLRQLDNTSKTNTTSIKSIGEKSVGNQIQIIEDFKKLEEFRENLDNILDRITIGREYDSYNNYIEFQRFTISEKIAMLSLESLLNNLENLIKNNILNNNISPSEFLQIFGNVFLLEEKMSIDTKDLVGFFELLNEINSELSGYSESIVKAIIDYINSETLVLRPDSPIEIDDDDLPF